MKYNILELKSVNALSSIHGRLHQCKLAIKCHSLSSSVLRREGVNASPDHQIRTYTHVVERIMLMVEPYN